MFTQTIEENTPHTIEKLLTLSVVIPVYNEIESLPWLWQELSEELEKLHLEYEVIFIDDSSTDGSYELLTALRGRSDNIRLIRFNRNYGQSAAMCAGFDHARGDIVVTMDADGQNDPADIPLLIEKLGLYDTVCGWRAFRQDSPPKKIFSKISYVLRWLLIGESVHDSGCTLRAYKKECIKDMELVGEMHRYIPAVLEHNHYLVGEVRVNHRQRKHGKTKYGLERLLKGFSDLIAITFWSRFAFRPMHIFGGLGIAIVLSGFLCLLGLLADGLMRGYSIEESPLLTLSVFAVLIGFQFLAIGILADISLKTYYRQRNTRPYRIQKML
jgi:glycosyltransferase involved in cell wall biosynthesis